jgi:hypothetical protein
MVNQWQDTADSIRRMNYWRVSENTFGHLAPEKNTTYRGVITCAKSCFESGTVNLLNTVLKDKNKKEMESSPWLYNAVQDLLWNLDLADKFKEGYAYVIETTFRNYQFWTKIKEIQLN